MDYLQLGRLVAITVIQGGPGLPLFDPPVAEYILTGRMLNLAVKDFPEEHQPLASQVIY